MTIPGRIAPIRIPLTDMLAIPAIITIWLLGGIIIANAPDAIIDPVVISFEYPRRIISGIIREPNMAVLARDDPLSEAKIPPPRRVITLKRPGTLLTIFVSASIVRVIIPDRKNTSPMI